jgi:hypothetical protein
MRQPTSSASTPASAHIPCGFQGNVLEEAHGICAVAVPGFQKINSPRDLDIAAFFWGGAAYGAMDEGHCALPY